MFVDPLKARHGPRIPRPCPRTVTKLALNISFYGHDGVAGQGLRQPHGGCVGHKPEALWQSGANDSGFDRPRSRRSGGAAGEERSPCEAGPLDALDGT
jgi:hypothetical protein